MIFHREYRITRCRVEDEVGAKRVANIVDVRRVTAVRESFGVVGFINS